MNSMYITNAMQPVTTDARLKDVHWDRRREVRLYFNKYPPPQNVSGNSRFHQLLRIYILCQVGFQLSTYFDTKKLNTSILKSTSLNFFNVHGL